MAWSLEGERHDDEPEWEPSKSGPEYHLNKRAGPRCLMCSMPARIEIDALGPVVRCGNRHCNYVEKLY